MAIYLKKKRKHAYSNLYSWPLSFGLAKFLFLIHYMATCDTTNHTFECKYMSCFTRYPRRWQRFIYDFSLSQRIGINMYPIALEGRCLRKMWCLLLHVTQNLVTKPIIRTTIISCSHTLSFSIVNMTHDAEEYDDHDKVCRCIICQYIEGDIKKFP